MAGTLTPLGRQQYLLSVHRPDLYDAPASLYLGVTTTVPWQNIIGSELDEPPSSSGYTREAYPVSGSSFWLPSGYGEIYNAEARTLPEMTAAAGMAYGWFLADAAGIGAGNVWAVGNISEPYLLDVGISPFFDVGDVLIGLYD